VTRKAGGANCLVHAGQRWGAHRLLGAQEMDRSPRTLNPGNKNANLHGLAFCLTLFLVAQGGIEPLTQVIKKKPKTFLGLGLWLDSTIKIIYGRNLD
jgi:hypothetical protein